MAFKMKGHALPGIKQRQASPVKGFKIKPKKKTYTKKEGTKPTGKYTKKEKTVPTGYYDSDETNKYTGKQARYGYASPTGDPYVKKTKTPPAFDSPAPKDPKYSGPLYKFVDLPNISVKKKSPAKQKPVKKAGELTDEQMRKKSNKAMKESLKPKARDPKKDKGGLKVNKKGSPAKYDYKDYKTPKKETKQRGGYNRKGQKVDAKGNVIKRDPSKDKGGLKTSPAKKPLVGKQKNLPEAIKKKILASPAKKKDDKLVSVTSKEGQKRLKEFNKAMNPKPKGGPFTIDGVTYTITKGKSKKKKSPAKNYKNPKDYKVFNMGNPVKKYKKR